MNAIKTKNVGYISISNSCVCYNKNFNIKIRNGDVYLNEPIGSGSSHSPRIR